MSCGANIKVFVAMPIVHEQRLIGAVRGERGAVIPLSKPVTADIAVLSAALAKMASSLEERANTIQRSVHHISHEFKTPLTSILGSIELMRDHGGSMSSEQRLRFLNNLEEDSKRLEHLLRSYLDLAKAEAILDPSGSSELNASIESCMQRYRARGLSVEFSPPTTSIGLAINDEA